MSIYGNEKDIVVGLTEKIDDEKYKSILYTDGENDFWVSRRYHTREHLRDNDYSVFIKPWLAKKIGII
ncbi:MAG: hypothetical protein JRG81_00240 [Deltaproteobacteria bacterium]|nr:hypothetical protein [Deltaproteobacteria bacterium]MBW2363506.1 hypothetical protein [Deltaproteobacteria bacterium]